MTALPAETWFSEISDADLIEASLWAAYESRFQAAHEMSLAYRYLPSTAEERVHVERSFAPLQLAGTSGEPSLAIDCVQLHYGAWPDAVSWSAVKDIKAADQTFRGKVLTLLVGRYYNRYLNAVAFQSQSAAS